MIIFLSGDDNFRSRAKLNEIRGKFQEKDPAQTGLSIFDLGEEDKNADIVSNFSSGNLFSPKRLIIVKNLISSGNIGKQEEVLGFLKNEKGTEDNKDLVIVFWEEKKVPKSNKLSKFLEKKSKSQKFEKLGGKNLEKWILERFQEKNKDINVEKEALDELIILSQGDSWNLANEIDKLVSYLPKGKIKKEDVLKLSSSRFSANIFETIDALGSGNKQKATFLLEQHLGSGEDPFYLFSMFIYQFRNLLQVSDLDRKNFSLSDIIKTTKLHPFVVKKSLSQTRRFSFSDLVKIYRKLSQIDKEAKQGRIDISLAIRKFLVEV